MRAAILHFRAVWGGRADLPRRMTQALTLFAIQGVAVLGAYAVRGFDTASDSLPPGFQLDPRHAVLHLGVGLTACAAALGRRRRSQVFLAAFGAGYLGLAALGTFTAVDFGMELEVPENTLHWALGTLAVVVLARSHRAPSAP